MSLTPADIHNTQFAKAPRGRRGYDENDVDVLLDEATGEMIRLLEENNVLRHRLGAGAPVDGREADRRAARAELSAATDALDRAHRACDRAEQEARLVRRQLDEVNQAAAAAATERNETSPERVLMMAQHTAEVYVREARDESQILLAEAGERAGRTLREARDAVAAIDRRSHDYQSAAAADLVTDRERVLRDIDKLTRFAADYHGALQRHLHRQGRLIDGTASQ
ncbi:DivIVA domain-containing protein [Mangrovihabitans endophyticus]|uniref:Cell wall synthesis protein Wag31 n=1 Tax=Mangrovihabitans endophyticus TaxID=1751298 RepID=A0A8J3C6E9_9ACTN|nr:DivIVA domain-containing protein [Mangrovihabitans endophyticus]GGL16015.1 cell wall synthesis protein Wag31 [Mangrovihabitans endophyticus]